MGITRNLSECEGGIFSIRKIDVATNADSELATLPDAIGWAPLDLAVVHYP